jgi:hypothetical protein
LQLAANDSKDAATGQRELVARMEERFEGLEKQIADLADRCMQPPAR